MAYLWLCFISVLSIELLIKFKFKFHVIAFFIKLTRTYRIIKSPFISDHWKEKTVPIYALLLLKNSFIILAIILVVALLWLAFLFLVPEVLIFALSLKGILYLILISYSYHKLRKVNMNE
jgi:hypothetical protein